MERDGPLGAYGFRLVPKDGETVLPDLAPAPAEAETVVVAWRRGGATEERLAVEEDSFAISFPDWIDLLVRREPATVDLTQPELPTPAALVHPLLTLPLAVLAHWRGCVALHGGAFAAGGRAWVVLGEQQAGKSTLLAGLGAAGTPVVADDLVVLRDAEVLAGPRCVDLRADAVPRFPGARSIGMVAGRHRHRLSTPPSPPRMPLGGFVVLEWHEGEGLTLERLPLGEQLAALHGQHYVRVLGPPHPDQTLALLATPMWRLRRGRDWSPATHALAALLDQA